MEKFFFFVDETLVVRARTHAWVTAPNATDAATLLETHVSNNTDLDAPEIELEFNDYSHERLMRLEPTKIYKDGDDPDVKANVVPVAEIAPVVPTLPFTSIMPPSDTTINFPKGTDAGYLGRNGTGNATGLYVFNFTAHRNIQLQPINSKEMGARCFIDVPYESVPHLISFLTTIWEQKNI